MLVREKIHQTAKVMSLAVWQPAISPPRDDVQMVRCRVAFGVEVKCAGVGGAEARLVELCED